MEKVIFNFFIWRDSVFIIETENVYHLPKLSGMTKNLFLLSSLLRKWRKYSSTSIFEEIALLVWWTKIFIILQNSQIWHKICFYFHQFQVNGESTFNFYIWRDSVFSMMTENVYHPPKLSDMTYNLFLLSPNLRKRRKYSSTSLFEEIEFLVPRSKTFTVFQNPWVWHKICFYFFHFCVIGESIIQLLYLKR